MSGAALMPGRQYKLANGLYGLIRGGLPIGGLSSPAPVIWVFPWALCKVNGIRPDKRQLVRDREAHRRGVVRRPVQRRGFRGLFCMALIDPAFTGSIEGSASKVYPGDFPGLKERHSFCLCGSSGGIGRFPCAFWKALLSWLGCCNNRRIKAKRKGLPLLSTRSQAPHAAYSIVVYPLEGTSAAACPTGPLDTGPFSRGPMDWPFPADAKGFQGRSSCLCDPMVPDVVCTSITYSLR